MIRKTQNILSILLLASLMTSCGKATDDIIKTWDGFGDGMSIVHSDFSAKRNQNEKEAEFTVYFGAGKGFTKDWKEDLCGCNPGYGIFAIRRQIYDEQSVIDTQYTFIPDFPDDEKYAIICDNSDHILDVTRIKYKYSLIMTFDFSTLSFSKGKIRYSLCYYDDVNQQEFKSNVYSYGISRPNPINFERKDGIVTFSRK